MGLAEHDLGGLVAEEVGEAAALRGLGRHVDARGDPALRARQVGGARRRTWRPATAGLS
jgi:hypothetical protein